MVSFSVALDQFASKQVALRADFILTPGCVRSLWALKVHRWEQAQHLTVMLDNVLFKSINDAMDINMAIKCISVLPRHIQEDCR